MSNEIADNLPIDKNVIVTNLRKLIENIERDVYNQELLMDIYEITDEYIDDEYINGEFKKIDSEALSYLFRGWFLTKSLEDTNSPEKLKLKFCPYCLKEMDGYNQ